MNKAYSLHIGINEVNTSLPDYEDDWDSYLSSCEADALAMLDIAQSQKYECSKILLTKDATREAFYKSIISIREQLKPGDLFLLTFAGHGGQVEDLDGDEEDGKDETWCFYDGNLLDDEFYEELKKFEKGIRILVISDSCHAGDILRDDEELMVNETDLLFGSSGTKDLPGVKASVLLLASCQESEFSRGSRDQGLFTGILLETWDEGDFEGNYLDFYTAIVEEMPFCNNQTPNYLVGGTVDEAFENSLPFSIL